MKVRIQSIHFDADKKLLAFIQKKTDKLDQFFDQVISAQVYLRLEKAEDELNKVAEIKVSLPGGQLFVKEQCKTFEEATDLAIETLKRQVNKYKSKVRGRLGSHKQELSMAFATL